MHHLLDDIIKKLPKDTKAQVLQAKDQFNKLIRIQIIDNTRFKLQGKHESDELTIEQYTVRGLDTAFPITIDDGYPLLSNAIEENDDDQLACELIGLSQTDISSLSYSAKRVGVLLSQISQIDDRWSAPTIPSSLILVQELAENLLKEAENATLTRRFFAIQNDILGMYAPSPEYRYRQGGNVHLYWMAIGIAAQMLQVQAQDIAAVTLIHELSHGYTNWGRDADGNHWDTDWMFNNVDRAVVEGLAQYYTDVISQIMGDKLPSIHLAYLRLRRAQRGWYRIHDRWVNKYSPEVVRSALVEFRRLKLITLAEFELLLEKYNSILKAIPSPIHWRVKKDIEDYGPLLETYVDEMGIDEKHQELTYMPPAGFIQNLSEFLQLAPTSGLHSSLSDWSIAYGRDFQKSVAKQTKDIKSKIFEATIKISISPLTPIGDTIKRLNGDFQDTWRFRIGDYRLLYQVDQARKKVVLLDFQPRRSVYND